jgi:AcrR family transcriptional regulator
MVRKSNEAPGKTEQILAAARKRFGYYGLAKTTMNEIAGDLCMSKASLYYYFPDKEALFREVIRKEQEAFFRDTEKLFTAPQKAHRLLQVYMIKRQELFRTYVNIHKMKFDHAIQAKPIFSGLIEDFLKREIALVKKIIDAGIRKKEFRRINSGVYARFFVDLLQGLIDKHSEETSYKALEKNFRLLVTVFVQGIASSKTV